MKPKCRKCKSYKIEIDIRRRTHYAHRCRCRYGTFSVSAAHLFLRYKPRPPVRINLQRLDAWMRKENFLVSKRHLKHVDENKPGIVVTLTHNGYNQLYLIEGHHRATKHYIERTTWSCYVLTKEETNAILMPICQGCGEVKEKKW